ncbi:MAG: hypothetical protein M3Z30_07290 [Gemmatimonadota bacterium]|nr:hypothetical protein [Gemmatimonadota bacterium]
MADVLVQFDEPQSSADGRLFIAQVLGTRLPTGIWEAWIEFHPRVGGDPVRTRRETEQLSRGDLRFWAAGLTREHLRAALERALDPQHSESIEPERTPEADPDESEQMVLDTNSLRFGIPVLDPMALYRRSGEYTLRQELRALDARQLADIIAEYAIPEMDVVDLARTYEDALAERIVVGVQQIVVREQLNARSAETLSRQ